MMKKTLLCIFLSLVSLLAACTNHSHIQVENTQDISTENTPVHSEKYEVEYPTLTFETVEEYNTFLKDFTVPNFVSYTMVEALGKFEVFTFLSNANAGDYSHYMYQLRDAVGFEVTLYVSVGNARETKLEAVKQKQVDTQNLRKLLDETKGTYTLNGFEYVYVNGELLSIKWQNNDLFFTIYSDSWLSNYPQDITTVVGALLSADTSSAAKETLADGGLFCADQETAE